MDKISFSIFTEAILLLHIANIDGMMMGRQTEGIFGGFKVKNYQDFLDCIG